jgi:hypothetical protein
MYYPQTNGMLAGNQRDSSIATMDAANATHTNLILSVGGKRKKGGAINIPQFQPLYNAGANGPNQIIAANLQTSTQSRANAGMDAGALQKGGKYKKKGGNPDWVWGCYSGGKKYKTRRLKNLKKSRKSKKTRKTKRNY